MKKHILVFTILVIAIAAAVGELLVSPGFQKRTDVCLQDFSISEDGSVMTVKTALLGSMGYIRAIETEESRDGIHCSFYSTFGGLNSGIGAKNSFEIKLDDSAKKIYFDRGAQADMLVLEQDATTGVWIRT